MLLTAAMAGATPELFGFRVFQYLTFRAMLSALTALLSGSSFGPWVIRRLAQLRSASRSARTARSRTSPRPARRRWAAR